MPPQDQPPANPGQPSPNPQPYQPPTMNTPGILPPTDPSGGYNTPTQTPPPKDNKMKIVVIAAVVFLLLILGVALIVSKGKKPAANQSASNTPSSQSAYKDSSSGFSFTPPEGWTKDTSYPGAQIAYKKAYTGTAPAVPSSVSIVGQDPKNKKLSDFADDAAFVVQALATDYKQDSKSKTKVDGQDAYLVEAHFNLGDTQINTMQLVTIKDKNGWIVTGMGLSSDWSTDKSAIKAALLSFKP